MILPVVDYKKWAEDYRILLDSIPCPVCSKDFSPTVPFAVQDYRGLKVADHGCGSDMPFRVVPVGDKVAFWEQLAPVRTED